MSNDVVLFTLISCFGMFVQSTVGFAGSLLAVPLFCIFWAPRDVIPTYTLVMLVVNSFLVWNARRHTLWKNVATMLVTGMPFTYLGVWALASLPTAALRIVVSTVTLLFAILFLFKVKVPLRDTRATRLGVGVVSGFLGGSISESGPPVVIYGLAQGWSKETFRATLLSYFFGLTISTAAFSYFRGLYGMRNVVTFAWAVAPVLAVALGGVHLKNRLGEDLFRKLVLTVIVVVSLVGFFNLK